MGRIRFKTGLIIGIYSIILTLIVIFSIYIYISESNKVMQISQQSLFLVQSSDKIGESISNGFITAPLTQAVPAIELDGYYQSKFIRYLPLYILIMVTVIFSLSFIMWKVIKNIENRQVVEVSKTVKNSSDNENLEKYLLDFKRLNSYISHEQKNTLALLRARLELIGNNELVKNIDEISNGIDDILTISSGKESLSEIDVAIICAEATDEYRKIYSNIKFDFNEEENFIILAKEVWIHRAVSNLIDNAIKYGNNSEINVCVENKKNSVIITVSDYGIGIDKDLNDRIFDNHFRINELQKNGYGIGLSLVKHVCDLCSGICYVDSEIGKGTTFYLVFSQV
jgi:Signal transduction histidine kinase